jgi:hypothetical protein
MADSPTMKRFSIQLLASLASYAVLLLGSNVTLGRLALAAPWAYVIALTPMIPCIAACGVVLRQLRLMDDKARRIQLEALGFAFAGTALLTFGYGFLERPGYPRLSMFCIWPLMAVLWCLGLLLSSRRHAA